MSPSNQDNREHISISCTGGCLWLVLLLLLLIVIWAVNR